MALPAVSAQTYRPSPNYVAGGKPDQAEGARILHEFRQAGIAGTYWLGFDLRVMPRKGDEHTVKGGMLGTRGESGPLTRLDAGNERWLIRGGPAAAAWRGTEARALAAEEIFQPVAGTDLTIFDLQMPFLQWTDFAYEGLANVRGRPAHSFVLYPPADLAAARPGLTGVRVLLDTQYQALVSAELLGAKGATEKSITILDLKKVGEQWLVKSIDLRNHLTRDKTRFTVTAAALDLALPAETFTPAALAADAPAVPPEKIQRF
ncbi:MAG TPA: outer membrane lipoprotein-sorting protein [Lacunisphaera sp.]|nr:outer membrane lipoprotein-sorting protein [Lacunisphaera sp.]